MQTQALHIASTPRPVSWAAACILTLLFAACDFTPDFAEFNPQEEVADETACGGDGILCNVAGLPEQAGSEGLGGPALSAQLNFPLDIAMAPITLAQTGEVYIVDAKNHAITLYRSDPA